MTSLQPQVVPPPPARLGGLSPEVLLFAGLLVLPALWHSVVDGDLALVVVLERYLVIVVGCAIVASLLQRYSESAAAVSQRIGRLEGGAPAKAAPPPARPAAAPDLAAEPGFDPGFTPAFDAGFDPGFGEDPLPDLGSLDDIDPLDLLSEESAEDAAPSFSLFDE